MSGLQYHRAAFILCAEALVLWPTASLHVIHLFLQYGLLFLYFCLNIHCYDTWWSSASEHDWSLVSGSLVWVQDCEDVLRMISALGMGLKKLGYGSST